MWKLTNWFALLSAAATFCAHADSIPLRSPLGTNLDVVSYYSTQIPFVDVMKSSGAWISGDSSKWDNQQRLDLDADGWVRSLAPGQIARTLALREIGDRFPAGQYVVRYKGRGEMKFDFAAKVLSQKPGEIVLQVTPNDGGLYLRIEATNPADYLRDIRITLPGGICEGDPFKRIAAAKSCGKQRYLAFADHSNEILFNPDFLDRLRNYSVLRFKDWLQTDAADNPVTNWSQRTTLSYRTWSVASGVPVEIMLELANRLKAQPWFTMPHKTDDAYARNFAQLVKAKLDPGLRVYVEHSNEVWNQIYSQYAYAVKMAAAQPSRVDNMQYHALRSRAIGETFKTELGAGRVISVLGAQAVWAAPAQRGLDFLKSRFGAASGIDAVAIAPYFDLIVGPQDAPRFIAMKPDELFAHVRTARLPAALAATREFRKLADTYRLALIAYEGGQHLVGLNEALNNAELTNAFIAFNRDPRLKQLYLDYLTGWKQAGGQLFVHYTDTGKYSKWGSWGSLEYIAQQRAIAPKFDALQTFIEMNPVWWPQ
jgi:hypothetical protein